MSSGRKQIARGLLFIVLPLALATMFAASLNFDPPFSGSERIHSVLLANGEVYFGHVSVHSDRVDITDSYYIRQSNNAPSTLIRLENDIQSPTGNITISRKFVVAIELVGSDSQVARAIRMQRNVVFNPGGGGQ